MELKIKWLLAIGMPLESVKNTRDYAVVEIDMRRTLRILGKRQVDAHARYKVVKDVLDTVPANLAQRISFLTD
jgi:hypothetical protein